jgi:hypothetical protein
MSSLNLVAICTKCSHPNALGSISELRFKQGQFRAPDRAQEFTCVSCGEKSTVKERDLQLICSSSSALQTATPRRQSAKW